MANWISWQEHSRAKSFHFRNINNNNKSEWIIIIEFCVILRWWSVYVTAVRYRYESVGGGVLQVCRGFFFLSTRGYFKELLFLMRFNLPVQRLQYFPITYNILYTLLLYIVYIKSILYNIVILYYLWNLRKRADVVDIIFLIDIFTDEGSI